MRQFLATHWMLPMAILVWAAFGITAAIQQEPIKAALGLGALVCACGLTWHSWKGYTSKSRPVPPPFSPPLSNATATATGHTRRTRLSMRIEPRKLAHGSMRSSWSAASPISKAKPRTTRP